MNPLLILLLLALLQTKHLVVDWCWQTPYELDNKGKYLHWGGIQHAAKHAISTGICFVAFSPHMALAAVVIDFLAHYHIDWAKMNLNTYWQLHPLHHAKFWWLMGADQWAHQMTYLLLTLLVF